MGQRMPAGNAATRTGAVLENRVLHIVTATYLPKSVLHS